MVKTSFTVYSRSEQRFVGRLLALPTNQNVLKEYARTGSGPNFLKQGSQGLASIEFPCMPDEIQLDRTTHYMAQPNMVAPDGFHLYHYTNPLEIPLRFKLFGSDPEYCSDGPATLLAIASRLHAFVLPLNYAAKLGFYSVSNYSNVGTIDSQKGASNKPTDQQPTAASAAAAQNEPFKLTLIGQEFIRPPVTCILDLIRISDQNDQMGIHCRGYVKNVQVKLQGPWLRGTGQQFNIPTSAEFGFTFVHVPSHQNSYGQIGKLGQSQVQAFAHDVIDKFYNTVGLNSVLSAVGFDGADPAQPEPPTATKPDSTAAPVAPAPIPGTVGGPRPEGGTGRGRAFGLDKWLTGPPGLSLKP